MHTYQVEHIEQLEEVARQALIEAGDRRKFALYGDLGAGKTTLIQVLCTLLGVQEPVASPSYSLVNEYVGIDTKTGARQPVFHMDLYRLKTLEEALEIGIEEYLDSPYFCFIEWPQVAEPILEEGTCRIHLEITGPSARKIVFL